MKTEKYILETAYDNSTKTKEAAIEVVLKEAKAQGLNIRPIATKLDDTDAGKVWQVFAEAYEEEAPFPDEVSDIVDEEPLPEVEEELPLEEEGDLESKVEELVNKVEELIENLDGDEDEEEGEDFGEEPVDFEAPEEFAAPEEEDDREFFSKRRRSNAPKVEEVSASKFDENGKKISRKEALKSASSLPRINKQLRGYKLAALGETKTSYVARFTK
jgi:hypothetical protein